MKIKLFFFFLLFSLGMNAQIVNIPNTTFKTRLLSASSGNQIAKNLAGNWFKIDANGDGQIQVSEAEQVSYLKVAYLQFSTISSLVGILSFTNLQYLDCSGNGLTSLDLQGLTNLQYLDCSGNANNLTSLDVQGCTSLQTLKCSSNNLTSLNVQGLINLQLLDCINNKITQLNAQGLTNLQILNCSHNQLNQLNVQDLINLQNLNCSSNYLSSLNLQGLVNLQHLNCNINLLTSLNIQGLPLIQTLHCEDNHILTSLNVQGITSLQTLNCHNNTQLSSLDVQGCTSLQTLDCSNSNLTLLNVQGLNNLQTLDCSNSNLTLLNAQGLTNLQTLHCSNNQLTQLNVQGLTNLQYLSCVENQLTQLNVQGLTNLQILYCFNNLLTTLDVHDLTNLNTLYCGMNQISLLNVQGCISLYELYCNNNQLSQLNLQGVDSIYDFDCSYNQITSLNFNSPNTTFSPGTFILNNNLLSTLNISSPYIDMLSVNNNQLTTIPNISANLVEQFEAKNNNFSVVDLNNFPASIFVRISDPISTINLSQNFNNPNVISYLIVETSLNSLQINGFHGDPSFPAPSINIQGNNLNNIDLSNYYTIGNQKTYTFNTPNIKTLKMKDGFTNTFVGTNANTTLSFTNPIASSSLYLCTDDADVANFYNYLSSLPNLSSVNLNINSYCTFVPGGNYNTITGAVRFDENNNGCDNNDEFFEHMKLKINDGTSTGETFVKNDGTYNFYTPAGNFTVTAEPENPTLFTVTPFTFTTSFPNNNNNIFTQNICVTKNGNANDLEVVIAPETNATPGFDAKYKLMWRNKGNTTLSGNVTLTFDSSKMTFVSSVLPYASIVGNQITFNFSNLKPYANTASEIIFKINTPTHPTNPVNSGDILNFSAVVNPLAGDFTPEDNSFSYKQTVVNSFDPNDIVCMEGNSIPQSMVGKYLHYIVNFENTGTAPATNIVVEMDIDPNDFDISTLQLQNASHQVYTKVKNNKVEFIMEYANLGNGGHGNILMKMLSKNTLASGDNVNNKANIYFDYNFPIVTNDAVTTVESGNVLQTAEAKIDNSITIFPIPTNGEVNINADSKISSIEVYDIQGRIIQKQIGINNQSTKLTIHSNSSGVFLFKVNTEKGILMKKVIKN